MAKTYIVKEGETFSSIVEAQTSPPPPLYGENGRLQAVLKLNPNILDPNDIKAGDVIVISIKHMPKNTSYMLYEEQKRSLLPVEKITNPLELLVRLKSKSRYSSILYSPARNKKSEPRKELLKIQYVKTKNNKKQRTIKKENIDFLEIKLNETVRKNLVLKEQNIKLKKENNSLKHKVENLEIINPLDEIKKINSFRKISSIGPDLTQSEINTSNERKEKILNENKKDAQVDEKPLDYDNPGSLEFGLGWGPTFYLHDQQSELGTAQLGTLFLNNLEFYTAYVRDDFKLIMRLSKYNYNYDDGISSSSKPITTFMVDVHKSNFIYGLSFEQQPLLKNSAGKINVLTDTVILPRLGYFWDFELSKKVETRFQFSPIVNISAGGFSSDPTIEIKEHSGFGVDIDTRLIRRLNSDENLKIYYFWDNSLSYRGYERSVDWGSGAKPFSSTHTNFNSTMGISIKFDN